MKCLVRFICSFIAGNLAKIIKENITWKHETVAQLLINRESK